ncbi:response regulator transcription factor [Jeotgalibacillus aurantiacus]|uniref:response regulator transcription factor n=1 Tax=Jeotgalibacillus aurantiacus TaxID=2763266 RepID=UPI001D0B2D80|nr:response regulator transcription factor [Jeotgalibacillus aurantiacus]
MNSYILVLTSGQGTFDFLSPIMHEHSFIPITVKDMTQIKEVFKTFDLKLILIIVDAKNDSGFEWCKEIRSTSIIPIIFISPLYDGTEVIRGLDMGADDFIIIPTDPNVLAARIRATLRRSQYHSQAAKTANTISLNKSFHTITLNFQNQKADINGTEIILSSKEFHILATLIRQPNQPISQSDLYTTIWGTDSLGDTRTLKVHISHLRKKLETAAPGTFTINAVRGVGYELGV